VYQSHSAIFSQQAMFNTHSKLSKLEWSFGFHNVTLDAVNVLGEL